MIRITSRVVLVGALGAVVMLSVGAAFVAVRGVKAQSETKTATATKGVTNSAPQGSGGAVIFIDPKTGKTRQPDASEIGTLLNSAKSSGSNNGQAAGKVSRTFKAAGGGVGMVVDPSFDCSMVATKAPDGKMKMDCVVGKQAAAVVNGQKTLNGTESHDEK